MQKSQSCRKAQGTHVILIDSDIIVRVGEIIAGAVVFGGGLYICLPDPHQKHIQ